MNEYKPVVRYTTFIVSKKCDRLKYPMIIIERFLFVRQESNSLGGHAVVTAMIGVYNRLAPLLNVVAIVIMHSIVSYLAAVYN